MTGGDLSAILVALSGLEFGNALLPALGMPCTAIVDRMITDFALVHGVMETRALILDTKDSILRSTGGVNPGHRTAGYAVADAARAFLDRLAARPGQCRRDDEASEHPPRCRDDCAGWAGGGAWLPVRAVGHTAHDPVRRIRSWRVRADADRGAGGISGHQAAGATNGAVRAVAQLVRKRYSDAESLAGFRATPAIRRCRVSAGWRACVPEPCFLYARRPVWGSTHGDSD
jgi:hypothetical protein